MVNRKWLESEPKVPAFQSAIGNQAIGNSNANSNSLTLVRAHPPTRWLAGRRPVVCNLQFVDCDSQSPNLRSESLEPRAESRVANLQSKLTRRNGRHVRVARAQIPRRPNARILLEKSVRPVVPDMSVGKTIVSAIVVDLEVTLSTIIIS